MAVALFLGTVGILLLTSAPGKKSQHADFFGDVLATNHILGMVYINGFRYDVGSIVRRPSGRAPTLALEEQALRTMYSLALARRAPLFGLAGVEPKKLDAAIDKLARVQAKLVGLQKNPRDARAVNALYPIHFLRALARLEEKRLAFLQSASNTDAMRYDAALAQTIAEGKLAVQNFEQAFNDTIGAETFRIGTTAGVMSEETMRASIKAIQIRMEEVATTLERREICVQGDAGSCESNLSVPQPLVQQKKDPTSKQDVVVREVLALYREAIPPLPGENKTTTLISSTCASSFDAPYVFLHLAPEHAVSIPYRFAGDMLFFEAAEDKNPLQKYLHEMLGITYSRLNPFTFYTCPELGSDLARLMTIEVVSGFAEMHPTVATKERANIVGNDVHESDVHTYMERALWETRQPDSRIERRERETLEEVALIMSERTIGLDVLIDGIATVLQNDIDMFRRGVPFVFVTNAKTLFRAESAFPSLFLAQSPHGGEAQIVLNEENEKEQQQYFEKIQRYSKLRESVPRETLLRDIREYARFEGAPL